MVNKLMDTINISFLKKEGKKIRTFCFEEDITMREFFRRASDHYINFIKNNK